MNDEIQDLQRRLMALKGELSDAIRRAEPQPVENHTLRALDGSELRLADLFGDKDDLLVIHNMGKGCTYCTLWADGFNGLAGHFADRAAFVLCSNDSPDGAAAFSESRGWAFRVVSGEGSSFAREMGYADESGRPHPGVSAFRRRGDGSIVRTGTSPMGPGDDFCSVWPMFDMLEGGAGDWAPKLTYSG